MKKEIRPDCHPDAVINASLADGVLAGSCSVCGRWVVRVNPKTGQPEALEGRSPWDCQETKNATEAKR